MSQLEYAKCACANCGWTGTWDEADREIRDFWSRVAPGDTVPVGECSQCECLVYLLDEKPAPQPICVYLNLSGGEIAADHLLAVHLDFNRLEGLSRLVAEQQLDSVAIRPPYTVEAYGAYPTPPSDGFMGHEAADYFESRGEGEGARAEPSLTTDGVILHIGPDGFCYAEAATGAASDTQTEAFTLKDLAAHMATLRSAEAVE